ncbi:unnamed protein product, partial [Ectocarpus sp. 8 AP-2014]
KLLVVIVAGRGGPYRPTAVRTAVVHAHGFVVPYVLRTRIRTHRTRRFSVFVLSVNASPIPDNKHPGTFYTCDSLACPFDWCIGVPSPPACSLQCVTNTIL